MQKTTRGRGRPKSRSIIICKETRERLVQESCGNLSALWRSRYKRVSFPQWFAAMRGEPVCEETAQLIENQ